MAKSIGDWFADHSGNSDSGEDEVIETQAPWDLGAADVVTTRSARRQAGGSEDGRARQASSPSPGNISRPERRSRASVSGAHGGSSAVPPIPKRIRRTILAMMRANPDASAAALTALLARSGTTVTTPQVAVVMRAAKSTMRQASLGARADPFEQEKLAKIRRATQTHPHLGVPGVLALLRSRGVNVTKEQVAGVLAQRPVGPRSRERFRPDAGRSGGTSGEVVNTAPERPRHEDPLCPSCGARPSVYGICRCS